MKIIIADSSPLYAQGVELVLRKSGITVDTSIADNFHALSAALKPDAGSLLAVVDSRLGGLDDLEALAALKVSEDIHLLMLTDGMDIALMRRARMLGIEGVVAKTAPLEELGEAIRVVMSGGSWRQNDPASPDHWCAQKTRLGYALCRLSNQENKVLNLVRRGMRNKQIAAHMSLTEHTVKTHMSSILRKLEVENRTQLVVALQQL